mmetsp:Transcript_37513/g.98985  ORF Transcript_37513/g.98985 Transcript_37513/m.98985 type:complete len:92 (+) Transcript_37513:646-921(+)
MKGFLALDAAAFRAWAAADAAATTPKRRLAAAGAVAAVLQLLSPPRPGDDRERCMWRPHCEATPAREQLGSFGGEAPRWSLPGGLHLEMAA